MTGMNNDFLSCEFVFYKNWTLSFSQSPPGVLNSKYGVNSLESIIAHYLLLQTAGSCLT